MRTKISTLLIIISSLLYSCQEKTINFDPEEITATDSLNMTAESNDEVEDDEINIIKTDLIYPKSGIKPSDFLPTPGVYKIQYETTGDLNQDGKDDIALVLVHKKLKTAPRPMLILLQNEDKSYRLDKISQIVFPVEYNDFDFKIFDTEDIAIENGGLNINLYGMGPSGTIFGTFKYIKTDFVLTYVEAYYRGAGGSTGLIYDLVKDEITVNETNTMDENMPTVSTTSQTEGKKYCFENTSITDFFNEE